jgi:hypothetical protein
VVIVIDGGDVDLVDAEDTRAFHVEVRGDDDVAAALEEAGAGTLADDGDHAHIAIGWVRQHAVGVGPEWEQEFDAMLDFARTNGWIEEGSSSIVAHLERGE